VPERSSKNSKNAKKKEKKGVRVDFLLIVLKMPKRKTESKIDARYEELELITTAIQRGGIIGEEIYW